MRKIFVEGVSNVQRFLSDVRRVEERGAEEASWQLVEGDAGLGKTHTLHWWRVQKNAVYVRLKSKTTVRWLLRDLVQALDEDPRHSIEALFNQVVPLVALQQRPIIIDEIDHGLHDARVIEALRDITDFTFTPLIIGGYRGIDNRIKAYGQIHSRITSVTTFEQATLADVQVMFNSLCEVPFADDVPERVLARSNGYLREIKNSIAAVERIGKRTRSTVTLDELPDKALTNDGRTRLATGQRRAAAGGR